MKIGIIGAGILGNTQKEWLLKNTGHEVLVYDIDKQKSNSMIESVIKHVSVFIICLPTDAPKDDELYPIGDYLCTDPIVKTIEKIQKGKGEGKRDIIIRSTVPVGFTRRLANKYPDLNIYFVPEFLTEKTASEDFESQKGMFVGVRFKKDEGDFIAETTALLASKIFPSENYIMLTYEDAEMLKLATNSFYALKVTFANELADICGKTAVDYEIVKEHLSENPRIGSDVEDNQGRDVHLRIAQDGRPGYGGKCLTKDTRQLIETARKNKAGFGLLEKVDSINSKIRDKVK